MELLLKRKWRTDKSTIGELSVDGKFECFILEDKDRGLKDSMPLEEIQKLKVHGKTAIPSGKYRIGLHNSPRFGRTLPHVQKVKGYEFILIHSGNTAENTEGCLLPGRTRSADFVGESRVAFTELNKKIRSAMDKGESVFITVE